MTSELIFRALINGALLGAMYGVLGMGFSMVHGIINIPNFAHGVYALWAMYALLIIQQYLGVGPYPGFIILLGASFLFGMATHKGLFKFLLNIEHEMQLMFCLGLMIIFSNLATVVFGPTSYLLKVEWIDRIIYFGGLSLKTGTIVGGGVSVIFVIFIQIFFSKTETGKAIRACANNRRGAFLTGLNVEKMYTIAIGISVVCSAIAGLAFAPLIPIYPEVGFEFGVQACLVAVLGGSGSMTGALIGGFIMGFLLSIQQMFYDLSLSRCILYAVMLVILGLRPTGILGKKAT